MANLIITTMKDEDNLVVDFIVHHLGIGFDKIIIFDDFSKTPIGDYISILPDELRKKVECYRLPEHFFYQNEPPFGELYDDKVYARFSKNKQMYLCNFAMKHFCKPTDWVALTDVDEFISIPTQRTIGVLRQEIERRGYSAISLTMLVYGHSFNLVAPKDNNLCAFIWRAQKYSFHGKFFAHIGALSDVSSPHYPPMHAVGLFCNGRFEQCERENCFDTAQKQDFKMPHLKHYMILDVYSCLSRRMRAPLDRGPYRPDEGAWVNRIEMFRWSSSVVDATLATSVLNARVRAGLDITAHARALSNALELVQNYEDTSGTLDFDFIRSELNRSSDESDGALLFRVFSQNPPDSSLLRFFTLPNDFEVETYRAMNPALSSLSKYDLKKHFLNYGRFEGRPYK
ncbi:MAG: glycosyltransferase family 2 protein [Anaerolineaceae bacterium]|nr:glycosyltransferase family 2 protein [Anaerolineaceae bacterium]